MDKLQSAFMKDYKENRNYDDTVESYTQRQKDMEIARAKRNKAKKLNIKTGRSAGQKVSYANTEDPDDYVSYEQDRAQADEANRKAHRKLNKAAKEGKAKAKKAAGKENLSDAEFDALLRKNQNNEM